jgi:hypothetical protein
LVFLLLDRHERSVLLTISYRSALRAAALLWPQRTPEWWSRSLTTPSVPNPEHHSGLRGTHNRLRHTPAGFTALDLDGYGLRDQLPARPAKTASYPVPVRQVMALLHGSFRPRLTTTPLRFANPLPSSGWVEDLHLQAAVHARHTIIGALWAGAPPQKLVLRCSFFKTVTPHVSP